MANSMVNYISFEPLELDIIPKWNLMIEEIIKSQEIYENLEGNLNELERIECTRSRFKEVYAVLNTDPPKDKNDRATPNLLYSIEQIVGLFAEKDSLLMDENDIKTIHTHILRGIPLKEGSKNPGELSERRKYTTYKGKTYIYPFEGCLEKMDAELSSLLKDFCALLIRYVIVEGDQFKRQLSTFKICAWFLFEILDLHPFSDANGRLFRAICSFFLSPFGPFPVPIYNKQCINEEDHQRCGFPCKDDYEQALVDARTIETDRHPRMLCTMMIYCCWDGWKSFLANFQDQAHS